MDILCHELELRNLNLYMNNAFTQNIRNAKSNFKSSQSTPFWSEGGNQFKLTRFGSNSYITGYRMIILLLISSTNLYNKVEYSYDEAAPSSRHNLIANLHLPF